MKRVVDVFLAMVGLITTSPLWVLSALAIKIEDGGPILYRQLRWGRSGSQFLVLKLRTMRSDPNDAVRPSTVDDPRVTHVGKILRATGIDELPQLINIARGEMSFVGPRALAVGETVNTAAGIQPYAELPGFDRRSSVPPGLTGPATIYLSKDAPTEDKMELDLRYVEEQSFWLDVRLILMSIWISLRGRWESRDPKLRRRR